LKDSYDDLRPSGCGLGATIFHFQDMLTPHEPGHPGFHLRRHR
jgi:hypothetical protein